MDIQQISKLPGVLGVRLVKHSPRDITEAHNGSPPSVSLALNLCMEAVSELGDCRLTYGGKNGVTVTGQHFDEVGVTVIVATTTGHPVAKSILRVMRGAAGLKRDGSPKKDAA